MDLTQIKGGGNWLRAGVYVGTIAEVKPAKAQTGSKGFEVYATCEVSGKMSKNRYWLYNADGTENKGAWRFKNLVVAAGITNEEQRNFNYNMLLGKRIAFAVQPQKKDPKYHEIGDVAPPDEKEFLKPAVQNFAAQKKAEAPPADEFDGGDFAPFDAGANDTTDGF